MAPSTAGTFEVKYSTVLLTPSSIEAVMRALYSASSDAVKRIGSPSFASLALPIVTGIMMNGVVVANAI